MNLTGPPPNMITDYLILLLSTDWFLPYWDEIGIELGSEKRIPIQQGCREIVREILQGRDDFFFSEFSQDRIRETGARFLALARESDAEDHIRQAWDEWAEQSNEALGATVECALLNREICAPDVNKPASSLAFHIRAEVAITWEQFALDASAFRRVCLESETEWDIWTRRILGSPISLVNQLWRMLLDRRLRSFWEHLLGRLTPAEVTELVKWYRAMTGMGHNEGAPGRIPSYMN